MHSSSVINTMNFFLIFSILFNIATMWQFLGSKQFIRDSLRERAVSRSMVPKQGVDAKIAILAADGVDSIDFEEVISQVATNIHGYYVSKSYSEHPEYDQLRYLDSLLIKIFDCQKTNGFNAPLLHQGRLMKHQVKCMCFNA